MEDISGNVLLDACFLIEANSKPEVFGKFIAGLREADKSLLSIYPVKAEFVRTKSAENMKIKSDYYDKVVEVTLDTDNTIQELLFDCIKEYGNDIDGVSLTLLSMHNALISENLTGLAPYLNNFYAVLPISGRPVIPAAKM